MAANHGLAIIGFGGMGSQHAKMLKNVDHISVCGIYDIDGERNVFAEENGYRVYKNEAELLGDPAVDIVLIATPNHVHRNIAIRALKAGKNVICEKPVTISSTQLEEIVETAKACGKIFVVHQNRRWDEDYLVMKKIYDEKLIGDIYHIETRVMGSRGIPGDWRHYKEYGGGMILDWGVHLIDRLLVMVDEKIKKVYCQFSYQLGNDVDDGFRLLLTFESGKTALVEVQTNNFITLPKWYMNGETGTAVVDDWAMNGRIVRLKTFDGKDAKPIEAGAGLTKTMAPRGPESVNELLLPRIQSDVRDFYRNVMDAVEGKGEQLVKNREVLRVLKLIEAAHKSYTSENTVDFE